MYSPQIIRMVDVLPLTGVEAARGVSPRSLILTGSDFRDVTEVLVNGHTSPSFLVMSRTKVLAEVPDPVKADVVYEAAVLSASLTLTEKSLVEFTVGTTIRKVRGPQRLMQEYLRILLRSPGSNKFHPNSGGGLSKRIGTNMSSHAAADITVAVGATTRYVISKQTPVRSIPPSERLLTAELIGVNTGADRATLNVTIKLINHSGQSAAATLIS